MCTIPFTCLKLPPVCLLLLKQINCLISLLDFWLPCLMWWWFFFLIHTSLVNSLGFASFCNFSSVLWRRKLESLQVENKSTYWQSNVGIKHCTRNASEFFNSSVWNWLSSGRKDLKSCCWVWSEQTLFVGSFATAVSHFLFMNFTFRVLYAR